MRYDDITSWIQVLGLFYDAVLALVLKKHPSHHENKFKPIYVKDNKLISMSATWSIRQAKKLVFWSLKLAIDTPGMLVDTDLHAEAMQNLDMPEYMKVINAKVTPILMISDKDRRLINS